MIDEAKTKDNISKFVAIINEESRVEVKITGPHVNSKTLNRIILAIKKTYRNHIRDYRKQVRRDMTKEELESIVAVPADLVVEKNGRVLDEKVSSITEPIAKVIENKKLSLQEVIDKKREQKLAQTTK